MIFQNSTASMVHTTLKSQKILKKKNDPGNELIYNISSNITLKTKDRISEQSEFLFWPQSKKKCHARICADNSSFIL